MKERAADDGDEARLEPTGNFTLDVLFEIATVDSVVGVAEGADLVGILVGEDAD